MQDDKFSAPASDGSASSSPDALGQAIADQVRRHREARGWSLAELATESGVSKAMISRIERAEASPTATLLARLSGAFGVSLSTLLAMAENGTQRLQRAADQPTWTDPATGYVRRVASPPGGAPLELVQVELPPGARVPMPAVSYRALHEQVWLLSGRLNFEEGTEVHQLAPGDCLQVGPPQDCAFHNPGPEPARYVVAIIWR